MSHVRPCAPNSRRGTGAAESDADDASARVRKLKLVSEYFRVENHSTFGIFPLHNFLLHVLSSLPECSLINISFSHLHLLELELWLLNGGL